MLGPGRGGGPGVYAEWLAGLGYRVHLLDPVARHVEEALAHASFTAALGDARHLEAGNASYDAVLLMGPLYHLTERADRLRALGEARRVVVPGGRVIAVGISRFASLLDGLRSGWLNDARFRAMVDHDLATGQHRNPAPDEHPEWFTTAYLHHPFELRASLRMRVWRSRPSWPLKDQAGSSPAATQLRSSKQRGSRARAQPARRNRSPDGYCSSPQLNR